MGVKKAATISHVFQGRSRTICDFKRTVFANSRTSKICLEEGTHLSISRSTIFEYEKVQVEREHVDHRWNDDQTNDARKEVLQISELVMFSQNHILTIDVLTTGISRSPNLFHRSSMVYSPTRAVPNMPTHLTLQTHPILIPLNNNHKNHSGEKLSLLNW